MHPNAPSSWTISADNKNKVLGAPLPPLTASYTGFVNSDSPASLTTPPNVSTTATQSSDVIAGGYAITAATAVGPDYNITYPPRTLPITQANQPISLANPPPIIYRTALHAPH